MYHLLPRTLGSWQTPPTYPPPRHVTNPNKDEDEQQGRDCFQGSGPKVYVLLQPRSVNELRQGHVNYTEHSQRGVGVGIVVLQPRIRR